MLLINIQRLLYKLHCMPGFIPEISFLIEKGDLYIYITMRKDAAVWRQSFIISEVELSTMVNGDRRFDQLITFVIEKFKDAIRKGKFV